MQQTATNYYLSQTRFLFHSHIKIKIPLGYDENILDACFALMESIDVKYNSYQNGSYFNMINKNAGNWVEVDSTTIWLLERLKNLSSCTNGCFDITSMPLIRLWGFYDKDVTDVPSDDKITEVLQLVDFENIDIEDGKVRIKCHQEIITGSFLKSYAVDLVIKLLKDYGISDALINAGGSTFSTLNNKEHSAWFVNLPHPVHFEEKMARLSLSSQNFSMSANMYNALEIDGKKYSHIINAKTGWPSDNLQTGVIAESAMEADMLSTALFCVSGAELEASICKLKENFNFSFYHIDAELNLSDMDMKLNTTLL